MCLLLDNSDKLIDLAASTFSEYSSDNCSNIDLEKIRENKLIQYMYGKYQPFVSYYRIIHETKFFF